MTDTQLIRFQRLVGMAIATSFTLFPFSLYAQVIISEIMYDAPGLEGSGEHDWVEVFNAGTSAADISSYRFFEANTNHTLKLDRGSATLPSEGYAVIASATSTFLSDWPAFSGTLFDSSFNLSGSGETIGIRVDTSDTSHDLTYVPVEAASNNGSSLHRTSASASDFSAGAPSPGSGSLTPAASGGSNSNSASPTSTSTASTSSSPGSAVSSYVPPPEPQVFAYGGDDRAVIVGADTEFSARAYNRNKETISGRIRFLWNFGDGSTAEGQSVLHHFEYPGRYAVILNVAENMDVAPDRIIVTAEPAKLAFNVFSDGSVMIENRAGRDLNLSNWLVRSFGRTFALPKDSIILAGESLRIGEKTLGFRSSNVTELDYPNGVLAFRAADDSRIPSETASTSQTQVASFAAALPPAEKFAQAVSAPGTILRIPKEDEAIEEIIDDTVATTEEESSEQVQVASDADAEQGGTSGYLWWLGALGFAVVGTGAVLASRQAGKREWEIIEEE